MSQNDLFCELANGRRICYRSYGDQYAEPLILVTGLGLQQTNWPQPFIDSLVANGLRVITLDNRDSGRSFFTDVKPPTSLQQLLRKPTPGYELGNMASDVNDLMRALHIDGAHLLGMSMGGMIVQILAARYPYRVKSITSLFSTTGSMKVGQPALRSILLLIRKPPTDLQQAVEAYVDMMRLIGSTLEFDEQSLRDYAALAWERGGGVRNNLGIARQIGAIINSGDRTAELSRVQCPTLVIHGDKDLMVAPSGGYATAAAINGARLVILPGMGHDIPLILVDTLVSLLVGHTGVRQRSVKQPSAESYS